MSSVVKTLTPFTDQALLQESLERLDVGYQLQAGTIVTSRQDYFGGQRFELDQQGRYRFRYDSDADSWHSGKQTSVHRFLSNVEREYLRAYDRRAERLAETERQRLEEERIARVEAIRLQAIERAKAQGYSVKENHVNGKIQLVLTRTVY